MRWPCSRTTSASTSPSTPSTPASWRTRWDTRSGRRKAAPSSPISFSWRTFSLESITSLLYISWRWQLVFFTFLDVDIGAHCPGLWRAHGLKCFSARLSSSDNTTRSGALQYIGYTLVWMHVKFWRFAGLLPWLREAYSHRRWKILLLATQANVWSFGLGVLSYWLHRGDAVPVAKMSSQAGTSSGSKSKGCDLQIYMKHFQRCWCYEISHDGNLSICQMQ